MASAIERWDRLAVGLLWTGVLFCVFTVYEIFLDGDGDWRGAIMTIVPAILCFAGWRFCMYRADNARG